MNELNNFFLGVQQVAQDAVDKAPYDRTFRGIIKQINNDGTCNLEINNRQYDNVKCPVGLQVNEVVDVLFPQNNASKMKVVNSGITIIEEGISGIWSYRKWSDGKAECWGNQGFATTISESYGSGYRTSNIFRVDPFPTNLFVSLPTSVASVGGTDGHGAILVRIGNSNNDIGQFRLYSFANITSSHTYYVNVYSVGKWK